MRSRAQVSVEFFIFVGLAFLIAIAFTLASLDQLQDFRIERESEAVKDIALKIQKELLIAASVEDGYIRVFEMPLQVENINYSLTTLNYTIINVLSKNSFYTVAVPKAVGNVTKGTNKINKTGGIIYINSQQISYFTDTSICQNAQDLGLCGGLDIIYGVGYQATCCSEHILCC